MRFFIGPHWIGEEFYALGRLQTLSRDGQRENLGRSYGFCALVNLKDPNIGLFRILAGLHIDCVVSVTQGFDYS